MSAADLKRPILLLHAVALASGAAWRLRRPAFHLPFDRLVEEQRTGAPLKGALADPLLHLRVVSRLLPVLPPRRMGRCMKRSLLLLHLWSRCGLAPCLHLGVAGGEAGVRGHAWLTAEKGGHTLEAGSSDGRSEAFAFPPRPA
jgi:hypothetical protein